MDVTHYIKKLYARTGRQVATPAREPKQEPVIVSGIATSLALDAAARTISTGGSNLSSREKCSNKPQMGWLGCNNH
ncbi:MAG: hypothetical protein WC521_00970 [Bdellovibrionales bacterium]|jgi:hypothetical protein